MERHISLADVEATVKAAYERVKEMNTEGSVCSNTKNVDADKFGIVVTLTDGRTVKVGDTDVASPLGGIVNVPLYALHREQKLGQPKPDKGCESCCCKSGEGHNRPKGLPLSAKGLKLVSKIQPQGDSDGKYDVIEDMIVGMMGSAPVLNDELYRTLKQSAIDAGEENAIAAAGYELYDNTASCIDVYSKLCALMATPEQVGVMGATIAADGRNPINGEYAFDGEIAPRVVAYMAAHGPHHLSKKWLVKTGLPAKSSCGGMIAGVYPGVMSIVAYSPVLNEKGVSMKAAKAIRMIMKQLDINVFDSAHLVID